MTAVENAPATTCFAFCSNPYGIATPDLVSVVIAAVGLIALVVLDSAESFFASSRLLSNSDCLYWSRLPALS